jgi:hypothetical protein
MSGSLNRAIAVGAAMAIGLWASGTAGTAGVVQGCAVCQDQGASWFGNCMVIWNLWEVHKKIGDGGSAGWDMHPDHDSKWRCGSCEQAHAECPFGSSPEPTGGEDEVDEETFAAVLESGDAAAVHALMDRFAGWASIHDDLLVIRRCDGVVTVSVRLSEDSRKALRGHVPFHTPLAAD